MFLGITFYLCIGSCFVLGERICTSMDYLVKYQLGQRFTNVTSYYTVRETFPVKCVESCMRNSVCKSVNYVRNTGECHFYQTSSDELDLVEDGNFIWTNVRDWPADLLGDCFNHTCPQNTICTLDKSLVHTCVVVGCLWTPLLQGKMLNDRVIWAIGMEIPITCLYGFYETGRAVCTSNGTWIVPQCKAYPITCEKLKECNASYVDGEYWLFALNVNRRMMKVYCHNMALENPSEFITLHYNNFASKSEYKLNNDIDCSQTKFDSAYISSMELGEMVFTKIGLNPYQLRVKRAQYAFAQGVYKKLYGSAAACSGLANSNCSALGKFVVDLRNTSFAVSTVSQWEINATNTSYIEDIVYSSNDEIVQGSCGGQCGGCNIVNLLLVLKDDFQPPEDSAIFPNCVGENY